MIEMKILTVGDFTCEIVDAGSRQRLTSVEQQLALLEQKLENLGTVNGSAIISSDDGRGNVTLQNVAGSLSSSSDMLGNVTIL